jgi:hypothetical protein
MANEHNCETVQVIARIRPEPKASTEESVLVIQDETTIVLLPKSADKENNLGATSSKKNTRNDTAAKGFKLDRVYGPNSTQEEVYTTSRPLVLSVPQGYNATVYI